MIVKLPKRPIYSIGDIYMPAEDPTVYLTAIKGGWMLYSTEGKLIGQVLADKEGATFVVGDSRAYRVVNNFGDISIKPLIADAKAVKYDVFGDVTKYRYDVYEYKNNSVQPAKVAQVIPSSDTEYMVNLDEKGNVYRNLLLVVTITLLVEQ